MKKNMLAKTLFISRSTTVLSLKFFKTRDHKSANAIEQVLCKFGSKKTIVIAT